MRKIRAIAYILLVSLVLLTGVAIIRPPSWRASLYDGMFDACRNGSVARARIWMFLGASPDGESDYDAGRPYNGLEFTSLVHAVVDDKDCRLLRLLLAKGASPNLELGEGTTPLVLAVDDHNTEAVKILLDAGANPRYSDHWTAVDQARVLKFPDLIPIIQPYLKKE